MTERYDTETAKHYAAYRPPLHRLILERAIQSTKSYQSGLDVGCGTGISAEALAEVCDQVCGIDASQQMLDLAKPHPKVTYVLNAARSFEGLPGAPFEIVTFAGSLFYTKSGELRTVLNSACCSSATVIVYDFQVLVEDLTCALGITETAEASDYDHDLGLSDWEEFEAVAIESERLRIDVTPEEAAHVLLSDSFRYDALQRSLGNQDLFENLTRRLDAEEESLFLDADIWSKRYRLLG